MLDRIVLIFTLVMMGCGIYFFITDMKMNDPITCGMMWFSWFIGWFSLLLYEIDEVMHK